MSINLTIQEIWDDSTIWIDDPLTMIHITYTLKQLGDSLVEYHAKLEPEKKRVKIVDLFANY